MFSALKSAVGTLKSENIPETVKTKSFYELKAVLPGKDKVLDFVSTALENQALTASPRSRARSSSSSTRRPSGERIADTWEAVHANTHLTAASRPRSV